MNKVIKLNRRSGTRSLPRVIIRSFSRLCRIHISYLLQGVLMLPQASDVRQVGVGPFLGGGGAAQPRVAVCRGRRLRGKPSGGLVKLLQAQILLDVRPL